jgi:hypothetical protein
MVEAIAISPMDIVAETSIATSRNRGSGAAFVSVLFALFRSGDQE